MDAATAPSTERPNVRLIEGGQHRRGSRVIAYIRVSDFKHGDGKSPAVQLAEIRRYCEREGLVIVAVVGLTETKDEYDGVPVVEDLDQTGRSSKKRKIAPMIKAIRDNLADGVVVWKVSRWGRNMVDSMLNIHELHAADGFILSTSENLNEIDSPVGKYSLAQWLLIAQLQSDQIGEVWKNIRNYRWGEGVPATGGTRWGYAWNRKLEIRDPNYYARDEEAAYWVERCYKEYVAGRSFGALVEMLRSNRAMTPSGTEWTEGSLRQTMDTGFAAGWLVRYNRQRVTGKIVRANPKDNIYLPGRHEPIIMNELWEKYKAARIVRMAKAPTKTAVHKLSGLLTCTGCGSNMTLWGTKAPTATDYRYYRYYVCTRSLGAKQNKIRSELHCKNPARIRDITAEKKVLEELLAMASSKEELNVRLRRQQAARQAQDKSKKIRNEIETLRRRRSRAYGLLLDGKVPDHDLYEEEDRRMATRIAQLEMEEQEASVTQQVNEIPETTVFEAILRGWDVMSQEAINLAIKQVVRHVHVTHVPHPGRRSADPLVKVRWMWESEDGRLAS